MISFTNQAIHKLAFAYTFLQVQIHHLDILSTHDVPNYTYLHTNTPLTTPHNTHTHTNTLTYKITTFIPNLTYPDKLKHLIFSIQVCQRPAVLRKSVYTQ